MIFWCKECRSMHHPGITHACDRKRSATDFNNLKKCPYCGRLLCADEKGFCIVCARKRTPPPFDQMPHAIYGNLSAWITDPPGLLDRVAAGEMVTAELAHNLTVEVDRIMRERWTDAKQFVYVHDFSQAVGFEFEALRLLVEWGHRSIREVGAIVVIISESTREVDKSAVYLGRAAMRVFGVPMDISTSLEATIAQFGLRPADRG
jgi:hypothetical protein